MITVFSRTTEKFFTIHHVEKHSSIIQFRLSDGTVFAEYDNIREIKRIATVLMTGYDEASLKLTIDRVERLYRFGDADVAISYEDGDILSDKLFSFAKEFEHENSDETGIIGFVTRWSDL